MAVETWIKQPELFSGEKDETREVFDFSAMDDEHESLFLHTSSKSRWLITTSVAGVAGALVIGAALIGTFEFSGVESPAIAAQHTASLWQQPSSALKGDRIAAQSKLAVQTPKIRMVSGHSYKKVSLAFDNANSKTNTGRQSQPNAKIGLMGSLAPEYPRSVKPSAGIAKTLTQISPARPVILRNNSTLASLDPNTLRNNTTVRKTPATSHTERLEEVIGVEKGNTLLQVLIQRGTPKNRTHKIITALAAIFPAKNLKQGHKIHITYDNVVDKKGFETLRPIRVSVIASPGEEFAVVLNKHDGYSHQTPRTQTAHLNKKQNSDRFRARARIRKSLYFAAKEQGIPERVIVEMMRIHAYDVDFQRQVRPGDSFEVFYDTPKKHKLKRRRRGAIMYSALTINKKTHGYYRFTSPDDGITDYYDGRGRSATKFLMRSPINGARITSSFGLRRHPITRTRKMHRGVDFAARYGTPVKSAGHGLIEKIGWVTGYGKYIRMRHANGYKTAYAHMSRFAAGLKAGAKIQQGQVIGYVGSTGRSTGAHLHYEIIVNNRHVNPMRLRMPTGRILQGKVLKAFLAQKIRVDRLMRSAPVNTKIASARK